MLRNPGTCPTTLDGWRHKHRTNKTRVLLPRPQSTARAVAVAKSGANAPISLNLWLVMFGNTDSDTNRVGVSIGVA